MAEYELIEQRLISGKGVLKIPADKRKMRHYVLYADMVRLATSYYASFDWSPGKGLLARLMFYRDGYLLDTDQMVVDKQQWQWTNDPSGQQLIALKCAYAGVLQSFINTDTALGLIVTHVSDQIKDYDNLRTIWHTLYIKCHGNFAIEFKLYALPYDTCDPEKNRDKPPPPPPPPPPRVPPPTPIGNISPPYDTDTSDGGNTEPYDGDNQPPPADDLPGQICAKYEFDYYVKLASESDFKYFNHYLAYGEVEALMPATPGFFASPRLRSRGSSIGTGSLPEECGTEVIENVGAFVGLEAVEIRNFSRLE